MKQAVTNKYFLVFVGAIFGVVITLSIPKALADISAPLVPGGNTTVSNTPSQTPTDAVIVAPTSVTQTNIALPTSIPTSTPTSPSTTQSSAPAPCH